MGLTERAEALAPRVERVLSALGVSAASAPLCGWIARVAHWNERVDLTAARDDDELVDLMIADAALLSLQLGRERRVVDVGTGAGAPGLPLAMLRPDLRMTLVEPMQKRVVLLRLAAAEMADAPRIVRGRGESLGAERFDVAISRATLPPAEWLALGARLAPAGEVWVLLAREEAPSLAGWERQPEIRYRWPLTGVERRAVAYRAQQGAR